MKEYLELRIIREYESPLFKENDGVNLSDCVKKVKIDTSMPIFEELRKHNETVRKSGGLLFAGWRYKREYTEEEIKNARFFLMILTRHFEPAGEECGTVYDEAQACPICKSGAKQLSPLRLKRSSIPHTDIATTIAGGEEIVVSERFVQLVKEHQLTGIDFAPIMSNSKWEKPLNYYQVRPLHYLEFSEKTQFGHNPFDLSERFPQYTSEHQRPDGTIYQETQPEIILKCPRGDNAGDHILTEAFIKENPILNSVDFFASKQTIGARMGLHRQRHLLFCSNRMMQLIKKNKLKGFDFEIAHIVNK